MNVLPGTVMMPDMMQLMVTSTVTSRVFQVYRGLVTPRDNTYSFVVHGEIARDVASDAIRTLEGMLADRIEGATSE